MGRSISAQGSAFHVQRICRRALAVKPVTGLPVRPVGRPTLPPSLGADPCQCERSLMPPGVATTMCRRTPAPSWGRGSISMVPPSDAGVTLEGPHSTVLAAALGGDGRQWTAVDATGQFGRFQNFFFDSDFRGPGPRRLTALGPGRNESEAHEAHHSPGAPGNRLPSQAVASVPAVMPSLLVLRGEDPPDDAAVVVRGGEHGLDDDVLRRTAERTFEDYGFHGVSVFVAVDGAVDRLCAQVDEVRRSARPGSPSCRPGALLISTSRCPISPGRRSATSGRPSVLRRPIRAGDVSAPVVGE